MHTRNNGVLNEKWLFHGMKTKTALDGILQGGFDARLSNIGGKHHRSEYHFILIMTLIQVRLALVHTLQFRLRIQ